MNNVSNKIITKHGFARKVEVIKYATEALKKLSTYKTIYFREKSSEYGLYYEDSPLVYFDIYAIQKGWHIFGLSVGNGFHSALVLVDVRSDKKFYYWLDQLKPGNIKVEPGSKNGFRQYTPENLEKVINSYTQGAVDWWNNVKGRKNVNIDLHIWKYYREKG